MTSLTHLDTKSPVEKKPFVPQRICDVPQEPDEHRWLIETIWFDSGVGILGGPPKCMKTLLATEIAMAVASGKPALGQFPTRQSGPVLFFGAEDTPQTLRRRFEHIAAARSIDLEQLPLYVLDIPVLRLNHADDIQRLQQAIEQCQARMLMLDPFIRMVSGIDENSAADVATVLGHLRTLQRKFNLSILLVHHCRKSPSAHPSYALRGSGDFAAWSDTNLLLSRRNEKLTLCFEHRYAPSPSPVSLKLNTDPAPHLMVVGTLNLATSDATHPQSMTELQTEILQRLGQNTTPMTTVKLRELLCKRKQDVVRALNGLKERQLIARDAAGWIVLSPDSQSSP